MTRVLKWISITLVLTIVSTWLILFLLPLPPLSSEMTFSRAVYDDNHHLLRLTLSQDGKYRLRTSLADISPAVIAATLLQEDQYYYWHRGINPVSMMKAIWQTYIHGGRRMGASTITMQTARIRYHIHSKTIYGKWLQSVRALQLEMHYTKEEILEAYLNLAPYGNNIEGVGAASLVYFGKPAHELLLSEAFTLIVIPQNPTKRLPDRGMLQQIRHKFFLRWLEKNPQDAALKPLFAMPLQIRTIHQLPYLAPHFVNDVLVQSPASEKIITTLHLPLQKTVETIAKRYVTRKAELGVNNVSVMLVDTRDMSVKALLGSADFFAKDIGGQINGTKIKRSPGSTLKPFIYALALDQGLIHPGTMLKDVPRSFGSYNPENFDYDFVGPITAKDALITSRNIPAVYLADQLHQPALYDFLQAANVRDLKAESHYGLALVLGGAELTIHELIELYAALGNEGVLKPIRYIENAPQNISKRILSAEASYLVLDMLKDTPRPGEHYGLKQTNLPVAWKTGTSSGYRDAWAVGLFGPYAMVVWVGNFNNKSNQTFVGKIIAAPLFFEIEHAIEQQEKLFSYKEKVNPKQLNLVKIDICKASGLLPTRYCTDTEKVWFIPGKSPIKTDTIYREIAIDKKKGLRTCRFNQDTTFEVYEFWPSDLLKIFKRAGVQRRMPPPYDATCLINSKVGEGFTPQISSPASQVTYVARAGNDKVLTIPFNAIVDADVQYLYWFVNDNYLGKTTRDQALMWHATSGKYVVRVIDDYGRSDAKDIKVQLES